MSDQRATPVPGSRVADALRWEQQAQNRRHGLTGADQREAGFKDAGDEAEADA